MITAVVGEAPETVAVITCCVGCIPVDVVTYVVAGMTVYCDDRVVGPCCESVIVEAGWVTVITAVVGAEIVVVMTCRFCTPVEVVVYVVAGITDTGDGSDVVKREFRVEPDRPVTTTTIVCAAGTLVMTGTCVVIAAGT